MSRCSSRVFLVKGLVGLVLLGKTFFSPQILIISGALYTVQSGIVSPQFMTVPFSIEMVIWVAVGGRGTLLGAILGAVLINYAKSLVSEALPASWMFIQGGLFILVVTALPEGVLGWLQGEGPRNLLQKLGLKRKIETYPSLEIKNETEG